MKQIEQGTCVRINKTDEALKVCEMMGFDTILALIQIDDALNNDITVVIEKGDTCCEVHYDNFVYSVDAHSFEEFVEYFND